MAHSRLSVVSKAPLALLNASSVEAFAFQPKPSTLTFCGENSIVAFLAFYVSSLFGFGQVNDGELH